MNTALASTLRSLARILGCCTVVAFVPLPAGAQALSNLERQLLPFQGTALRTVVPRGFWDALASLRAEEDKQRSLNADISFGLSGDEAGARSLFKLNTGVSLSRGVFPSELSVESKLGLQLRDGQLQEDVTSMQMTYDYHSKNGVEYFAFAERFTDSFLSIQQRYEVGLGARVGVGVGRVGDWEATDTRVADVGHGLDAIAAAASAMSAAERGTLPGAAPEAFKSARSAIDNVTHALREVQTRLFVGLAASLFAEIERAELDVTSTPAAGSAEGPVKMKVALDAQQRYRASVRPTFRFRPAKDLLIKIYPYFKLPLDGPLRATRPDGRRVIDYRRDVLSEVNWTIKPDQTGLESVTIVFTIDHHYDNAPPALAANVVADAAALGRTFDRREAETGHRVVALSLKLKW